MSSFFIIKKGANTLLETVTSFIETWGYLAMFIAMVLENANIPIPSEIVLGFAGYLVAKGVFDMNMTIILGTLAGIVGSILSYWMGQYGGRPLLIKYGKYMLFNEKKFHLAEKLFLRYGGRAVFIGRLLPGVRTFISFPAGVAQYNMPKFIIYTILGTIPWTILLVWMGKVLGDHWEDLIEYGHYFLYATVAGIVLLCAVLFYKWRQHKLTVVEEVEREVEEEEKQGFTNNQ